ncbi:hypothetical protein LAZ67_9000991, partial [Cordylochernes scorpioides]
MIKQETQTKMGEYHFQPFRNPSIFTGERNQNPEKWLKEFHRVARYNCWDDSMCLANVYFFLQGTAHRWYENVEEKINSWDIFVKMFSQNFGHHVTQKDQLAENLKTRAQGKEETSDSYIQDVLHLCREVNPAMMENEIVAHLTKGISEEIYQSIIILDIAIFDRLPNVAAIDSANSESMEDLIRRIVREEVHRALNPESTTPEPSSLKEIIREEIEKNVAAISKPIQRPPPRQSYPNQTRTFNQVPRRQYPTQTPIYNQTPPQRRTDEWRTHDNIPICFNCGRPGHVKRYCRERRQWTQRPEGHAPSTQEPQMGSSFSVISDGLRRQLKKTMFKDSEMTLKVADGKNVTSIGRCTISLSINGLEQPLEFIVLPNSNPSIILGWDFLEASNAVIDCGRAEIRLEEAKDVLNSPASMGKVVASRSVVIPAESTKLINVMSEELNGQNQVLFEPSKKVLIGKGLTLPCALFRLSHNKGKLWIVNSSTTAQIVPKGMCLGKIQRVEENNLTAISECSEFNKEAKNANHASHADKSDFKFLQNLISDDLSEEQQSQILSILKRYDKIFDKNNEPVKQTSVTKHKIETGNHQPIKHRPYRVSPTERQAIQTEVDKMLDAGIIRHSESPWSSPVILVKKKDGNWRFCVDYRRLNKVTKKDVYPLPRIDDTLDSLKGAKFYSSMDLRSGYWQIEVDGADREKTAFITPDGLYEFLVMPFGLCNAPATFERMMDKILKGLKWTMALCYLDDIVVYSKSFNEHLHRLEIILQCLDKAELRLNPKKCLFGTKRIRVFGHLVDSKEQLPTELHTDASGYGIGAVLVQINDGKERPVGYASRTLSKAEKNYSTTERECLAAIWAINKFRPYLFGREFVIVTDHHALCWLSNLKDPTGRLARWALKLQEYNVTVVYKSGRKHQDADCLSRNPLQLESEEAYNDEDDDIPSITALTCFEAEQRKDPKISKLIEETERFGAESKGYEMLKGTLYKKNFDPLGNQHLLVIPKHLRLELLKSLHDAPTAGHLGFSKTYERVKNKYFWPGLLRDIRKYVAHCKECQRKKQSTQKPPGLLKAIPPATSPFQRVGMDLLGRFPKSDTGMFERFDENLENVENYIYRLKQFMLISKTKEDFKTPFLISCIGPKYFGILRNLVFPEEVDQVPFDKLCKILLKHFNPKTNIIYERFVFQKMDQKSGETISKYIIRLKEQAQRCNFGDFLQESLRDRFVAGIIDTPTQKKLLQEEGLTFEGALDIALSAESADNDLHNLKRSEDAHRSPQHLHAINNPCKHCGKNNHLHYNCFFKSANCRVCGRVGHISTICYKKDSSARKLPRNPKNTFNKFKKHANNNNPSGSQNNLSLNNIDLHPPLTETVYVNDIKLLAEIDTGAAITTLTKYEYFKYFKNVKLNKCNTVLTGYSGSNIPILGKAKFDIKLRNVSRTIEILITNLNCSKFLLGRDFLNLFNISFNYLHKLDSFSIDSLLNDYESIFECKSDPIKGIKCHLDVRADFIPKFYKFRQVPFALKQLVENEIDKLVNLNILSPIDKSDCASPLVCVAKPNGQIRLCADFKKSLNPYLEDVKYPIPNIDSVLSNFQGKKLFTKLDLSKAYHQIEMDDISKKYLVVSTHKGLYKYNRLAFGIKTASEIFQKTMESFFLGINDVYIYFDDILIASEDLESHLDILKRTLNTLKENNFTINKNKCLFVKNEIEYLGHKINEFGIYPLKDKLVCIKNCPVPKNITELKSFLGFLSFYSKFLPGLSDLAYPLYNLLKKNIKWSWNAGTDRSFNSCKNALDETTCLSHYSLNLPLILSCDASQVGIGASLSHLKDGEERPVCFISRTLNVHERKYSQVEREGLAIVFAVNKLKHYLFGRKFTIYTDHKPLITIFGDKTNLPPLIANRLHRWALTLSNYSFEIKYKKGKDNIIPDFLSRFPEFQEDNLEYNDGSGEILLLNTSIIDHVLVAHEIQLDRTLFKLYKIIETGELPSSPNDDLIPYLNRIDDFTILQECIFLENRMVIPKSLHERVLQLLHESHAGTNKMKMMARSSIWWPGMDSSIEIITKNCRTCLSNESLPPQRTESWPKYAGPWRRVHMDYFNFKNKLFLLAVDSFSSWVEVSEVPSTSAYFCINFMRNCIARYGFPQVVVSDNGPPFFSSDFGDFLSKNGISHVTSPPYHPQSNGQAEVSVREVKKLLKKQLYENEQVELNLALSRALFFIRTDVNIRKGTSPAELFLGRKIRSRLSVLSKEEVKASKFNSQYVNSKFKVDETVKFRWITNGHPSWYTGKIIKILGRNVYLIKQGDSIKKVHQNYIRKMLPGKSHPTNMNDAERVPTPISEEKSVTTPRLLTVTYGLSCAPYLAMRTLHHLARDKVSTFPVASKIVQTDFYVDDLLSGADKIEEATCQIREVNNLLSSAGFSLRKWRSNVPEVLSGLSEQVEDRHNLWDFESDSCVKILGIFWNPSLDIFQILVNDIPEQTNSKRHLLSHISRIFDPIGWLSPVIIRLKILLQSLWKQQLNWDDPLPDTLCSQWKKIEKELSVLNKIQIPRYFSCRGALLSVELHGFCDSSEVAYAAVFYIRSHFKSGQVKVSLIASLTRVAPLKMISIPRLELCAALLLATLYYTIRNSLCLQIDIVFLWTDSKIVLSWIKSESRHWKPFVGDRIAEIQRLNLHSSWHYVILKNNPADCASRGITPSELVAHSLWWGGPTWLSDVNFEDPIQTQYDFTKEISGEKRKTFSVFHSTNLLFPDFIFKYSNINELVRITAWIYRFVFNAQCSYNERKKGHLSSSELTSSIHNIIRFIQSSEFQSEITCCKQKKSLPTNSRLLSLNPFIDESGLLRVGGRLHHSNLQFDEKHPIILPRDHFITELIVRQCHLDHLHSGLQLTICLKSQILTYEELSTLTTQIEACLNSRPICPLSSDSDDFNPLTPGHFLIGRPLTALPESNDDDVPINYLDRWSLNKKIKNVFWKRWNREYLNNLQQRLKWQNSSPNIKEGDLILLKDTISPPAMYWSLGRITKVITKLELSLKQYHYLLLRTKLVHRGGDLKQKKFSKNSARIQLQMSRDERILQRKLSCQIRRIDGFIESVDSIIEAGETIRLEIMGEELKEIKEKIEKLYDELFSLDEVDIDKESEAYDGSMNKIGSLRVKIENERKLKDKLADIKPNGSQANIKLPQFDLPIYDGDMGNWINFKELFLTTIDAHPGLTNIQKLQYLNSAVKGEAARLIRGFPLLSENYGQAWSTLLSRYDNPRELAYAQVSKIFSLRAIKNPSAKCLHEFMDVCNEAIRNLETLELKRNQLVDVILVHFLQQKLSENLRLDWELSVDNTLPSYDKFIAFISRHARSMSCAVKECSKREETTGSRFPKCQSYGMLIEKSDTCILCKSKHHPLYMCNLFCKMPLKEKLNVVKGHKLCFNCLRKGHFSWNCRLNQRCKVCKGKHHTMIHYDKPSTEGASAQVENTTPKEHESAINLTNTQQANYNDSQVLLATARIKIKNGLGKLCTCRALLDSGSQVTMITKGCCERLGLVQRKSDRMIIGVGNTPVQHSSSTVSVTFCPLNNSEEFSVEAVVTGVLTSEIPNFRLKDPNWPTLKSLKLADPEFYIQAPIDMILGADIYTELMLNGSISLGEGLPMAINTRLGWVLLGKLMGTSESNTEVCNLSLQSEPELEFVMKRFWEIESVPSPDLCTQDEDCERLFSNNHGRDSHGRYWVKLPFRQHRPLLGESREKALRRFLSLEGKLCKNVKLYDQYRGFMKEYEHLNHMERVPIAEVKRELCRCYYMPHHPVIREQSTTTKMRVVFDASAKSENNVSLNQFLHKGPKIQQDVFFILLRFRTYPVAITADIEKMYRQIRIHPEDADYQRILWRPSPEEPVVDYRLLTVTYGTTSAPFLAMRTLQQLAEDEGHNYPEASRVTLNDFYVDDLLTGAQTIAEAKELIDQLKDLMKKGGFHLRKWNSNCHEIVSHVEEINEEKKINLEKGAISKILGIVWDHVQDTFRVNITLPEEVVTKRDLLSNIARIFDPLGFLSPTTVALKIIMQELWRSGTGWDEHIPNDIKEKWNNFRAELLKLGELSIPRYVWACEGDRDVQLHGFCDASSVAYSAVCYLRTVSLDGQVHISMLAAKTRVAPCKSLTLPRLELCAALLLSQLYRSVIDSLKIDIGRAYLWSDSQISLSWIKSDPNRWKTFIHNRVVKIQQLSDRNSWRHVSGKDNPADCASRGIMPAALSGHTLWWQGPTWLKDNNFVQNQDNCYGRECHEEEKVALACQSRVSAPNSTVASGQDPR